MRSASYCQDPQSSPTWNPPPPHAPIEIGRLTLALPRDTRGQLAFRALERLQAEECRGLQGESLPLSLKSRSKSSFPAGGGPALRNPPWPGLRVCGHSWSNRRTPSSPSCLCPELHPLGGSGHSPLVSPPGLRPSSPRHPLSPPSPSFTLSRSLPPPFPRAALLTGRTWTNE